MIALAKELGGRFEDAEALRSAFGSALAGELPEAQREHAAALLAEHPWTQPSLALVEVVVEGEQRRA